VSNRIRVGILDSGVMADTHHLVARGRRFMPSESGIAESERINDTVGHGTELTRQIAEAAPEAEIYHAQVFNERFTTTPALVSAGFDWLREQGVDIINMSFGMSREHAGLAAACARALKDRILLIGSAPAQGRAIYPAAWPGIIAVTGDARCKEKGQVSDLLGRNADFGAWCASPEQSGGPIAGSSMAAAHFSGLAAQYLSDHPDATRETLMEYFRHRAIHLGAERRSNVTQ